MINKLIGRILSPPGAGVKLFPSMIYGQIELNSTLGKKFHVVLRGNGNGSLLSLACLIIFVCLYIYLQFSGRPQQMFLEEVFNQTIGVL